MCPVEPNHMQKNFDDWNGQKKQINELSGRFYHIRDIWWCTLGVNVGYEQDGAGEVYRRPVLVLAALSRHTCLVVPLSTSEQLHKLRIPIGNFGGKNSVALISQIRVVDTRRFVSRIGIVSPAVFDKVKGAIKDLI